MADIVLGIGASHGPLLSTPPEQWDLRAKADRENKGHWFRGKTYDFESLLKERAPGFASEITVDVRRDRFAKCRHARWRRSARSSTRSRPTPSSSSATISASSSTEGLTPAITVYRGGQIKNVQHLHEDAARPEHRRAGQFAGRGRDLPRRDRARRSHPRLAGRRELRPGAVRRHAERRASRRDPARLRLPLSLDPAGHARRRACRSS